MVAALTLRYAATPPPGSAGRRTLSARPTSPRTSSASASGDSDSRFWTAIRNGSLVGSKTA